METNVHCVSQDTVEGGEVGKGRKEERLGIVGGEREVRKYGGAGR